MDNAIKIKNLTKNYAKSRGIEDVNLDIDKGIIYGFIGPNGAGKSTTIKCIMNMINKNSGEVYINGQKVGNKNNKIKEDIGYLPSEIHLYEDLTVNQMLKYSASFYKKDCNKKIEELVKKLEVDVNKKIDELSLGNLKKVGIILTLMHDPQIIIMDEASSGLDPLMQEVFYEIIQQEKQKGKTIFFSSHILSEIKKICDKVAIIKEGKIIKVDTIENMKISDFIKVNLQSEDIDKIISNLSINETKKVENETSFIYQQDINKLLKTLSKYNIEKLLIEELDIEEMFMHYYK